MNEYQTQHKIRRRRPPGVRAWSLALLAAAAACKKEAPKAESRPAVEVSVVKAEPHDMAVTYEFVAQTRSSHQVEIRSRVSGFLDRRTYTEGTVVDSGTVMFLMDMKPFQAQVNAASAALQRQKAALETARRNLERVKPLAAQNALSQKDLDDATGSFEITSASVEQSKAELETAQLNLSYCTIASPLQGITSDAQQQDGAYLDPLNSHLATVYALSPMWVDFSVSENEMSRYHADLAAGAVRPPADNSYAVEVVLVDGSTFPSTGKITFIAPSYSLLTGTFMFRATVENPEGKMRPAQYVRARLKGAVRPNAILVPQRAVQQGAKGHFLFVVDKEGKAEMRPATVGPWIGTDIVITEGLHAGDRVIVDGAITLRPGDAVHPKALAAESNK
jgi:membrane fusion protein (multidrug efflux system)